MSHPKLKKPKAQKTKNITEQSTNTPLKKEGCIIFSLRYIQKNHCYSDCQPAEKQALIEAMFKRREMTWQTIAKEHRHGLGYEKIERSSLTVNVPKIVPEDASILAFRFFGLAPMVGYKENDVFHILWLDRQYKVYPH